MDNGHVDLNFTLHNNTDRSVKFSKVDKQAEDTQYKSKDSRSHR
ncbi:hypothetical protein [Methyloprofundus sedimenti]|nr:hypothetical protein [Methyloprofundus sedimenti]